jgi:hypothetical protein
VVTTTPARRPSAELSAEEKNPCGEGCCDASVIFPTVQSVEEDARDEHAAPTLETEKRRGREMQRPVRSTSEEERTGLDADPKLFSSADRPPVVGCGVGRLVRDREG